MTSTNAPPDSPLSEADIQAYADGTLTPERAAFLRAYLGQDPTEARRVGFYGRLNAQIQQAFQTVDEPATNRIDRWRRAIVRVKTVERLRKLAGTLTAVVLALAAASGWLAATQVSPQALDNAALMALAEISARPFSAATPTRADPAAPELEAIGLRLVERRAAPLGPFQRASESAGGGDVDAGAARAGAAAVVRAPHRRDPAVDVDLAAPALRGRRQRPHPQPDARRRRADRALNSVAR
jgi:hypothetical protein